MPQIDEIRRVAKDEQRILEMLSQMNPNEFSELMKGQEGYCRALAAQALKEKEEFILKRKELEKEIEAKRQEEETKRTEMQNAERRERVEMERKHHMQMIELQTEEEKKRVDYALQKETEVQKERTKIKLEAKREFDRLDLERKKREEEVEEAKAKIRKRERDEEYERMAALEKVKLEAKSTLDLKAEVEMADHRFKQKLRMYEATKEAEAARQEELLRVEKEYESAIAKQKWDALLNYFSGEEGEGRVYNMAKLFALSIASVGAVAVGVPLARKYLNKYLFAPRLVSRQQKVSRWARLLGKGVGGIEVVLRPHLAERMERILKSTQLTAQRKGYYGNVLLYGRPGTGKTLWAEKLAQEAKMDFAVMSGPSFDQFETGEAIQEIKALFNWVNVSKNGVLLFIDEADSFLEDRSTLHPHRVAVLNEWINQTGTESRKFMCVYETNRPEVLDPAIQSRVSTSIEMEPPGVEEILKMLKLYVTKYVTSDRKVGFLRSARGLKAPYLEDEGNLQKIADRFVKEGFVGRDISNFAINLFKAGTGSGTGDAISEELVNEVIEEQLNKKRKEKEYLEIREKRLKDHKSKLISSFMK